jgi:hypothetical protein
MVLTMKARSASRLVELLAGAGLCAMLALASCSAPRAAQAPALDLVDTTGAHRSFPGALAQSKLTVLVFYADHCPCFRVHEERLRELAQLYTPQGVTFLLVDSEVDATLDRDAAAARERSLPPVAIDPGAKLADALGAEYATYTVVLDATGRVRYRGGIDTDKNRLTADAQPYLRDAIDDLLAGREPRRSEGKALGCALQTR